MWEDKVRRKCILSFLRCAKKNKIESSAGGDIYLLPTKAISRLHTRTHTPPFPHFFALLSRNFCSENDFLNTFLCSPAVGKGRCVWQKN